MLLVLFSTHLSAQDVEQLDWNGAKEKWGQLLFCQHIYKLPGVKSRLYGFDIEQCDKAGQLMQDVVAKYSSQEQVQLKNQAEQHAARLSHNTSDPYQSVPACREYCAKLAEMQDKASD